MKSYLVVLIVLLSTLAFTQNDHDTSNAGVAKTRNKQATKTTNKELRASVTAHSVTLNWGASVTHNCAVTSYNVHRVQTPGSEAIGTNFAVITPPVLTYIDLAVVQGQTYEYTVSAYGGSCNKESPMSNEITTVIPTDCVPPNTMVNGVCTPPSTAPDAPTGLTGTPQ